MPEEQLTQFQQQLMDAAFDLANTTSDLDNDKTIAKYGKLELKGDYAKASDKFRELVLRAGERNKFYCEYCDCRSCREIGYAEE
jgi:hypothetical protein